MSDKLSIPNSDLELDEKKIELGIKSPRPSIFEIVSNTQVNIDMVLIRKYAHEVKKNMDDEHNKDPIIMIRFLMEITELYAPGAKLKSEGKSMFVVSNCEKIFAELLQDDSLELSDFIAKDCCSVLKTHLGPSIIRSLCLLARNPENLQRDYKNKSCCSCF